MDNLTLETQRLVLRPVEKDDVDVAIEMFTDPDVMTYIGGQAMTAAEVTEEMSSYTKRCAEGVIGIWSITLGESAEKLGSVFLLPLPIEDDDTDWSLVTGDGLPEAKIEIGYSLKKSAWGQGYASEACKRLLRFAFEETALSEVVAVIDERHGASRRILEKSGMVYQGRMRAYGEDNDGYAITRQQWEGLP
jgi:[ribosomal protein S5]-alanine N-acetyltransferase